MKQSILAVVVLLTASALYSQSCMPATGASNTDNLSNIKIGQMTPSPEDGLIHVTYGFNSTVDQNTQTLFANAAQQWNNFDTTTGVFFQPAPAGSTPDITMQSDFQNSGGCIAIIAHTGEVAFNAGWQQLEVNSPATATGSIAQELGHYLGLADAGLNPSPPTIMNNPPSTESCADSQVPTTTVQPNDAQTAATCTSEAESLQSNGGGGGTSQKCPPGYKPNLDGGCNPSPIIIDIEGEGFHLTSAQNGVTFDIAGDGNPIQAAWTDAGFHNAFLALPGSDGLVHNGKELFGNFTPQPPSAHPNGFLALAQYDEPENGGNGDGIIDERDQVFSELRLWIDENHDGVCQPNELHRLPELEVYSLAVNYTESRRTDEFGNQFRYRARVNPGERRDPLDQTPSGDPGRWTYDVFFVVR